MHELEDDALAMQAKCARNVGQVTLTKPKMYTEESWQAEDAQVQSYFDAKVTCFPTTCPNADT